MYPTRSFRNGRAGPRHRAAAPKLKVYHKLLSSPGMRYQDLGADYYDKRAQASRKARYHIAELDALCYVVLTPRASADGEETGQPPAA